jgi:hypothetical protein
MNEEQISDKLAMLAQTLRDVAYHQQRQLDTLKDMCEKYIEKNEQLLKNIKEKYESTSENE